MKNSPRVSTAGLVSTVLTALFIFTCVSSAFAQKAGEEALDGWGKLGKAVSGSESFYDFSYFFKDERGRKKSAKAFVQISAKTTLYYDRVVRIQDLKKGSKIRGRTFSGMGGPLFPKVSTAFAFSLVPRIRICPDPFIAWIAL